MKFEVGGELIRRNDGKIEAIWKIEKIENGIIYDIGIFGFAKSVCGEHSFKSYKMLLDTDYDSLETFEYRVSKWDKYVQRMLNEA